LRATYGWIACLAVPAVLSMLGCSHDSPNAQRPGAGSDDSGAIAPSDGGPEAGPPEPPFDAGPIEPVIAPAVGDDWHAHDNAALEAIARMYDPNVGQWTTGPRWSFANDVEAVEASFLRTGGDNHLDLVVETYDLNSSHQFMDDNGYDDEAWWAHAWVRAYDLTGDARYLKAAKVVFTDMTTAWETPTCGGGVWWSRDRNYKNAITNELFLLLAASLHNRTAGDAGAGSYIDWALKEWGWFSASGMINAQGLVNDGLTAGVDGGPCTNNGQTTWTYNQGIVLGGLVELYLATGDASYVARAEAIADAAIARLTDAHGILQEPCGPGGCDGDQVSFKGLFLRNLARLHDVDRKAKYFDFMVVNARSVWAKDRDGSDDLGSQWAGPFDAPSAPPQSSAMFLLSSLADVVSPASTLLRPSAGPTFAHPIGARDGVLGWACDAATCPNAGLMQSGPFVTCLPPGPHTVHVRVSAGQTSSRQDALATIQVTDSQSGAVLAKSPLAWSALAEADVAQDFALPHELTAAGDPVEYQVVWNAVQGAPRLVVTDVSVDGEQSFTGANLGHTCGRLDGSWHWTANRFDDATSCLLTRGPGVRLAAGSYVASFELRVDEVGLDDAVLAKLAVVDVDAGQTVASADVRRSTFPNTRFQRIPLAFTAPEGHHWELQTQWLAAPTAPRLRVRGVHVRRAAAQTTVGLPFDARGIGAAPGDGSIDAAGSTLDAALLGATLDAGYDHFVLGQAGSNVLQGGGGAVALPAGKYASIALLGLAVGGDQLDQTFTVAYADGTSSAVTQSISDWTTPTPKAGERIARAMPYRWSATAKEYGNFHLFHYAIPLDAARTARSLTLPANASVKILAATLVGPG
jgi:predicted alpha-1,6-mannanase (GH76 family)